MGSAGRDFVSLVVERHRPLCAGRVLASYPAMSMLTFTAVAKGYCSGQCLMVEPGPSVEAGGLCSPCWLRRFEIDASTEGGLCG